uniref:Uncharacterized protein n=1 Tax=Anguilla anguilla TaxID=7936 RepID=A0A0E9S9N5_ANGAN
MVFSKKLNKFQRTRVKLVRKQT